MEQHPIPQNVTQYQFRLIGNMTIKQFAMLGACILCAFLFSKALIIPVIFRYPLVVIFVMLGLALAFLPYEERSLDVWLISFIKSIYSPTQYLWKVSGELPPYLMFNIKTNNPLPPQTRLSRSQLLQPYMKSMQQKPQNPIDAYEQKMVNNINTMFETNKPNVNVSQNTQSPPRHSIQVPNIQPKQITPNPTSNNSKEPNTKVEDQPQIENVKPMIINAPPIQTPLKVKSLKPEIIDPRQITNMPPVFSEDQMPPMPDLPNTIVGAIMTKTGQLIPNAIIEIRDNTNLPVRAIKTNRLGQFFIATPLKNGNYSLVIEHDTHSFDTIKIEAHGNIIPPLKIISN